MNNPIIIVGCGRSGTTLLYNILCCHPELGWFSNYTDRFPRSRALAALSPVYPLARSRGWRSRFLPIPSEAYPFWNGLCDIDGLPHEDPLAENDATIRAHAEAEDAIGAVQRFQRKQRFINKNTRNVRRMRYVDAMLDQPLFINVIRDPRATVSSLLRVSFWPSISVWSQGHARLVDWERQGRDPAELATHLWTSDVGRSLDDKRYIPAERYLEVRYEALVGAPRTTLTEVLGFTGLKVTRPFEKAFASFRVVDANDKFVSGLSPKQTDLVRTIAGPLARSIGYKLE